MIAELGIVTTGLAFLAAWYALIAALVGTTTRRDWWIISARNAALTTFPLLTAACGLLVYALVHHDYSIEYVWQTTDNVTPPFYLYAALWGSQAGSLLFWSWLMSAFTFAALLLNWDSERRLMPTAIAVLMATLGFFLLLNVFIDNPFARYWIRPGSNVPTVAVLAPASARLLRPVDGNGLNPLLRHFGMVIHPPMLYLGFVGFVVPFAFALAALVTGQLGAGWIRATRNWALVAWLFLSLGLLLGGRWAYDVLGWGGYWGWDPVENSALLPWLTGTAFLHSAVIQEKRGMLKFWNLLLIILTFILVIFGTFATRSGVISSVHSFARSKVGPPMFIFLGASMLISIDLLFWRQQRGDLRGPDELDSLFSRESLFLLNNWLFLGLAVVVFWGTWAEAITTIAADLGLRKTVINLGPDYFPPVIRPFLIGIFILMGVAPLAAWRRSTARRLGRALTIPTILTILLAAVLYATGTRLGWALLGYGLVAFAWFATLTEIWKGVLARHRRFQQDNEEVRRYLVLGLALIIGSAAAAVTIENLLASYFGLDADDALLQLLVYGMMLPFWAGVLLVIWGGRSYFRELYHLVGRDRRRYGGYFIHLGIVVIGLGVIGSTSFQKVTQQTLSPGDRLELGPYTMQYNGLFQAQSNDGRTMVYAKTTVYRGDKTIGNVQPRRDIFYTWSEAQQKFVPTASVSVPGMHSTLEGDFYSIITYWEGSQVTFRVYWNPLINFVWLGGVILIAGTLTALWPSRQRTEHAVQVVRSVTRDAQAGGR